MTMRILIAGHTGLPFGGIATYCESLLNSSLSRRVNVSFVETSRGGRTVSARGGWGLGNLTSALHNILRFLLAFVRTRPHVVHIMTAQMPSMLKHGIMLILARGLGAKVILHLHCGVSAMFPSGNGLLNSFSDFVLRRAHGILVLSQEWLNFKSRFGSIPLYYLPNGIQLEPYLALSRPIPAGDSQPTRILYLGHLSTAKGTLDLIEAARLLESEDFLLELIGEPLNPAVLGLIRERIAAYNLHQSVKIFAPEFGEQKLFRYACAGIFVLPSHGEGMPISIVESMAAGLPVVATAVGGVPEMILHGETGLLVPPENPQALADALRTLLQSEEVRQSMGSRARERARDVFEIEQIVPQLVEYYRSVGGTP